MHRPTQQVTQLQAPASAAEERAFDLLAMLAMPTPATRPELALHGSTGLHFKTTLLKTLFSSPMACLDTLRSHLSLLQRDGDGNPLTELSQLRSLEHQLYRINAADFSKYQQLLRWFNDTNWHAEDTEDRLVICTERLETLFFLYDRLQQDLQLPANTVALLHAGMRLKQRAEVVAAFRHHRRPVRLLLCADSTSTRMPLYPLSHRLLHFDLPWSAAVIRQRNARIEPPQPQQSGQTGQASQSGQITYLNTHSRNPCVQAKQQIVQGLLHQPSQPSQCSELSDTQLRRNCMRETAATVAAIERNEFAYGPRRGTCQHSAGKHSSVAISFPRHSE